MSNMQKRRVGHSCEKNLQSPHRLFFHEWDLYKRFNLGLLVCRA